MMFETTVRYNNNNNKHPVETLPEDYDSIVFEAHLAAFNSDATKAKIHQMVGSQDVSYYIDPILAEFEAGNNFRNEDGSLGNWKRAYVHQLGDPLEAILNQQRNADPADMADHQIRSIARSVVEFQETFAVGEKGTNLDKYTDVGPAPAEPAAVIPWYNKIRNRSKIPLARKILDASSEAASLDLKPCLYTPKNLLQNSSTRRELIDLIDEFDIEECFLIIEGLGKHDTSEPQYKSVIDYVYEISDRGIDPHFLYGDFFSHLLAYFGLGGTTYGTLYGEEYEEELKSYGDGGMNPRVYFDDIKEFLSVPGAVDLGQRLGRDVCDCAVCERHFDNWADVRDELATSDDEEEDEMDEQRAQEQNSPNNALNITQKHYLEKRWDHTLLVQNKSLPEVVSMLEQDHQNTIEEFSNSRQVGDKELDYMMRWVRALQDRQDLASSQ